MIDRYALIIGAMKCGTTSLYAQLCEHPQVAACRVKEPNFFADDGNWGKGVAWYESLWEWDAEAHRVALEASTAYSMVPILPNAAARIATVDAAFKFIYTIRDPVDRIESHLTHLATRGRDVRDIAEDGILDRAVQLSRYASQLDEYRERFPREDILVLRTATLRDDPAGAAHRLWRFLDLSPIEPATPARVLNDRAAMAADQRLGRWFDRHPRLATLARAVPDGLRRTLRAPIEARSTRRVRLTARQRRYVRRALHADGARLAAEYGVDTSSWST